MLSEVEYSTFAVYCNRGESEVAKWSKVLCGKIKNANEDYIQSAINEIKKGYNDFFLDFFGEDVTVIPCPSSSIAKEGFINPPLTICKLLVKNEYAYEVCDILQRKVALRKSSHCVNADDRPTIKEHIDSIEVRNLIVATKKITLVDDVLTLGRTTYACAQLLQDRFPNAEIRIFAIMRTRGMCNYTTVKNPDKGFMTYNPNSGKVSLKD